MMAYGKSHRGPYHFEEDDMCEDDLLVFHALDNKYIIIINHSQQVSV